MINVNFTGYTTYTVDKVTQWDVDRKLRITGINVSGPVTIYYSNKIQVTAVGVLATQNNGVITCDVPNGLLTESYPIYAYLQIKDGGETKTIETIKIPVTPATEPDDYKYRVNIPVVTYESLQLEIYRLQAAVGTPLVATTAAAMTDHEKVYVYVGSESGYTSGNWYYYNGSAWVSGGVYNSTAFETDKTLSLLGSAADAKATGDNIKYLHDLLYMDRGSDITPFPLAKFWSYGAPFDIWDMPYNTFFSGSSVLFKDSITESITWDDDATYLVLRIADTIYLSNVETNQFYIGSYDDTTHSQTWINIRDIPELTQGRGEDFTPFPFGRYTPTGDTFDIFVDMPINSIFDGNSAVFKDSISEPIPWSDTSNYQVLKITDKVYVTSPQIKQFYIGRKYNNIQAWVGIDNDTFDANFLVKNPNAFASYVTPRTEEIDGETVTRYYLVDVWTGRAHKNQDIYYCGSAVTYADMPHDEKIGYLMNMRDTGGGNYFRQFFISLVGTSEANRKQFGKIYARSCQYTEIDGIITSATVVNDWVRINITESELLASEGVLRGKRIETTWENKSINGNGVITDSNVRALSDFIPCSPEDFISVSYANIMPNLVSYSVAFFDSDKNFINKLRDERKTISIRESAPSNAAYFRIHLSNIPSYRQYNYTQNVIITNNRYSQFTEIRSGTGERIGNKTLYAGTTTLVFPLIKDTRNVIFNTQAFYTFDAGMSFVPVNAEYYSDFSTEEISGVLNPATLSNNTIDYTAEGDPTTYYLTTGEEINRRLRIYRIGEGGEHIDVGCIDVCHVPQPKIFPSIADTQDTNNKSRVYGTKFVIGRNAGYPVCQQFRLPSPADKINYDNFKVEITVPEGCTLYIREAEVIYSDAINRQQGNFEIDTHGSFMQYPQHSRVAINKAAQCGATRFITIPKCSSDGVWFAYHDDKLYLEPVGKYKKTQLRNADGTVIDYDSTAAYAPRHIQYYHNKWFYDIPFTMLYNLDAGLYYGNAYKGLRLMLIDEMFDVCAKTGMSPMFSMHPYQANRLYDIYLPQEKTLYQMAKRYGVLHNLVCKTDNMGHFAECTFQIFGLDIEKYAFTCELGTSEVQLREIIAIYDSAVNPTVMDTNNTPQVVNRFYKDSNTGKTYYYRTGGWVLTTDQTRKAEYKPLTPDRVMIELFAPDVTRNKINLIRNAGFSAGVAQEDHIGADGEIRNYHDSDDYDYYQLLGITETTDNKNASIGLAW